MNLYEQLSDMTARFQNVEKNQYVQINALNAKIKAVNNNYEILSQPSGLIIKNIIVCVLTLMASIILTVFFIVLSSSNGNSAIVLLLLCHIVPILAIIINTKMMRKKYQKKADYWWESTGKNQVVEMNNSISAIKNDVYNYLIQNPLYESFRQMGWANSRDCYEVYRIAVLNKTDSLIDAISIYNDKLEAEFEREEAAHRHQQILDALEEANAESVRLREELESQGRRADFDRTIIEMQLSEIRHR